MPEQPETWEVPPAPPIIVFDEVEDSPAPSNADTVSGPTPLSLPERFILRDEDGSVIAKRGDMEELYLESDLFEQIEHRYSWSPNTYKSTPLEIEEVESVEALDVAERNLRKVQMIFDTPGVTQGDPNDDYGSFVTPEYIAEQLAQIPIVRPQLMAKEEEQNLEEANAAKRCNGYLDVNDGSVRHNGGTCPIHG